jgi:Zn-dependent M28 family amino/carboxypeptidase
MADSLVLTLVLCYGGLGAFVWMMFGGIPNPHTVNDNTSGVCLLVRLLETLPPELRDKCCFVFFDNEENGLLGSAAFYKAHKEALRDKPMLNFDCLSDGDQIRLFPGKKADAAWVAALEQAFRGRGDRTVVVQKPGRGRYPSDQIRFPQGVGVAAFRKAKFWGLYISRIHTKRDTVWQEENLALLRDCCEELLRTL